jgi:pimeloyl-ACP methyl ester carboxylesterase
MQPTLESTDVSSRPIAVLVTGAWSPPEDWRLVIDSLRTRGIDVVAVDLPSNRQPDASRDDDVAEARRAITEAHRAVVVVGWSYGGVVISDAAAGQDNVVRLIYVAALPLPAHPVNGDEPTNHRHTTPTSPMCCFPTNRHAFSTTSGGSPRAMVQRFPNL